MTPLAELDAVLREERELLLSGNFGALQILVDRKKRLSEWLAQHKPDVPHESLHELTRRAKQNEALLESARRGLQAAMTQLRQTSTPPEQKTYSRTGERQVLSRAPSSVTQKI